MIFPFISRSRYNELKKENDALISVIGALKIDLHLAKKNDMPRDERNGRWTNKPST